MSFFSTVTDTLPPKIKVEDDYTKYVENNKNLYKYKYSKDDFEIYRKIYKSIGYEK
jgi:hypothetical protein